MAVLSSNGRDPSAFGRVTDEYRSDGRGGRGRLLQGCPGSNMLLFGDQVRPAGRGELPRKAGNAGGLAPGMRAERPGSACSTPDPSPLHRPSVTWTLKKRVKQKGNVVGTRTTEMKELKIALNDRAKIMKEMGDKRTERLL